MKFTVILAALVAAAQAAAPWAEHENLSVRETIEEIIQSPKILACSASCIYGAAEGVGSGSICDNIDRIDRGSAGCTRKCGVPPSLRKFGIQ